MREENYFEKKLETCKETLVSADRKLDHLDMQLLHLEARYEHDKKVYGDQIIHMQNIVTDMKKRIPTLEKKIKQGYTTVDLHTGKAYKSFKDRHIGHLEEKIEWTLNNQKLQEENWKKKQTLRKRKREKLKPEELEIVEAEDIRESLQGKDEIQENHEKRLEQLQKKADFYQKELISLRENEPIQSTNIVVDEVQEIEEVLEELEKEDLVEIVENHSNKVECPECNQFFTKGGAFASHYKSHFPNGNSKE